MFTILSGLLQNTAMNECFTNDLFSKLNMKNIKLYLRRHILERYIMNQSINLFVSVQVIHKVTGGITRQTPIISDSDGSTSSCSNKTNYYYA